VTTRSFTRIATSTIAVVIMLLFLAAAPVVFFLVKTQSETQALAVLDAHGRTVAADQQHRFDKIAAVETAAIANMKMLLAAPRADAKPSFDRDFPLQADGSRRSSPALFDGQVRPDGAVIKDFAGFIPNGATMPEGRVRTLLASFDAIRSVSGGMAPDLSSLYFFSTDNDVIIHALNRPDKLGFYRQTAPASFDFQDTNVAEIMKPANNPQRVIRCTDLEPAAFDPSGKTWTTGCMTPIDIGGRHVGSFGVSLLLNELLSENMPTAPPDAVTMIVARDGRLIYDPAHTRQQDAGTARFLDLTKTEDARLRAIWQFLQNQGQAKQFAGYVPGLAAYVTLNPVPTPGWQVITYFPRNVVLAQSVRAALALLVTGAIIAFAAIALLWHFIRRTVGRPMTALASRAEAIATLSGGARSEAAINSALPEEIARLNASFDVMEAAIAAERERLTQTFEVLAQSVENHAIYMVDCDGRITNWNRGAEAMTGYAADAAIGQQVTLFTAPDATPDEAADPFAMQAQARKDGRATAEGWRQRRDGTRFWASVVTEAILDPDGKLIGFAEIMRDTTDDRQRQLRLAESLRLLTLAEDMAQIGHWRMELPNGAVTWSPGMYRIHALDPSLPISRDLALSFFDAESGAEIEAMVTRTIASGKGEEQRTTLLRADGVSRHIALRTVPELGPTGQVAAIFGIMRDVTEETEAAAKLIAAREAANAAAEERTMLLATMSHEIRTPMTGIIGMLDLLHEGGGSLPRGMSIGSIAQSARTLMVILDDVLEHSRIESGSLRLENLVFDLPELLEQTAQMFRPLANAKNVTITIEASASGSGGNGLVSGDPYRIQQILSNFVGNAVKFTDRGTVRLRCHWPAADNTETMVRLEVQDSGIGITNSVLPTLFETFRQGDATIARSHGGSGLGLSICRRLATAMGGRIGAASTIGEGSNFWVELPLARARAADRPVAPTAVLTRTGDTPRVLIVEDTETTRALTAAQLTALGCRVSTATDGISALEFLARQSFDAVMLDHQMPDMNGATTARLVRLLPGQAGRVPMIGFTAGTKDTAQKMRNAGIDDILIKPFDRIRLAERLRAALERPILSADRDPVETMKDVLDGVPEAARQRLAGSIASDLAQQSKALTKAMADSDGKAAAAALHALAGVAMTIGHNVLADRCRFAEAVLEKSTPDRTGWLAPMIDEAIAAAQLQIKAVTSANAGAVS
jgi:PAS domain S-box-containing protein